jgi:NAD(P)-dependent dehydrogenase (short-subunit alcohol dehydrogenase family)
MTTSPVALVTGANRGLGFETSRQLLARGYTVLLGARDPAKALVAAADLGARAVPLPLDVTHAESTAEAVASVTARFGRLDALVNNAGGNFDAHHQTSTVSLDYVRETIELNLLSVWRITQAFLPLLRRSGAARIVNVSSGAGAFASEIAFGLTRMGGAAPAYSVSKSALSAFTLKLATELQGTGLLVNAVCPGWTATYPGAEAQGARPVADGAAGIVWAATLPPDGPSGGFFRDGQRIAW